MNARARHIECKRGAAVRLHGYAPAQVRAVYVAAHDGATYAECVITARDKRGPHGYRPGERVHVRASAAVPRDIIRTARGSGRLYWPSFAVHTCGKYRDVPQTAQTEGSVRA